MYMYLPSLFGRQKNILDIPVHVHVFTIIIWTTKKHLRYTGTCTCIYHHYFDKKHFSYTGTCTCIYHPYLDKQVIYILIA